MRLVRLKKVPQDHSVKCDLKKKKPAFYNENKMHVKDQPLH